ncbi:hypothetical protein B0H13DRAFT_2369150 [Mycena leptocephala]|nr:hypothetical protein B0H13DRAFT_2369150 [Mycena leptocephala]
MLRSHRILCSCVPAPLFRISPLRYTFALPFAPRLLVCLPARPHFRFPVCSLAAIPPLTVSRTPTRRFSAAHSLFPTHPLAAFPLRSLFPFPLRARCFLHTPSPLFRCLLAVSRTPTRISVVCSPFPARPLATFRCALTVSHASAHCLTLPARPLAALRFPSVPCARSPPRAPLHLAPLRFASLAFAFAERGEAEPGAERDKNWL